MVCRPSGKSVVGASSALGYTLWLWALAMSVPHALLGWYFLRAVTRSGILAR